MEQFSFHGLPMYGIFGILLLLFMKKLIPKPELVFFLNFAVYTLIEYLASWILELGYSLKVTAYSDYLFTLNEHTYIGGPQSLHCLDVLSFTILPLNGQKLFPI